MQIERKPEAVLPNRYWQQERELSHSTGQGRPGNSPNPERATQNQYAENDHAIIDDRASCRSCKIPFYVGHTREKRGYTQKNDRRVQHSAHLDGQMKGGTVHDQAGRSDPY